MIKVLSESSIFPYPRNKIELYKKIEICGRNAYKSEGVITEDSYAGFITKLISKGHWSVFEHGIISIAMSPVIYNSARAITNNNYLFQYKDESHVITANCRAWYEICQQDPLASLILPVLQKELPLIFGEVAEPSPPLSTLSNVIWDQHDYYTVRIIADRGFLAEITRHRHASFTVESTRYCNYGNETFGKNIMVIEPFGLTNEQQEIWIAYVNVAEEGYFKLLDERASPQWARSVLPQSTKTDIIMTAFASDWDHIFELRCASSAHPQMREVMLPLSIKILDFNK